MKYRVTRRIATRTNQYRNTDPEFIMWHEKIWRMAWELTVYDMKRIYRLICRMAARHYLQANQQRG